MLQLPVYIFFMNLIYYFIFAIVSLYHEKRQNSVTIWNSFLKILRQGKKQKCFYIIFCYSVVETRSSQAHTSYIYKFVIVGSSSEMSLTAEVIFCSDCS